MRPSLLSCGLLPRLLSSAAMTSSAHFSTFAYAFSMPGRVLESTPRNSSCAAWKSSTALRAFSSNFKTLAKAGVMAVGKSGSLHKYVSKMPLASSSSSSIVSRSAGLPVSALTTVNNGGTSSAYACCESTSCTSPTSSNKSCKNAWFAVRSVIIVTNFATMGGLRNWGTPFSAVRSSSSKLRIAQTTSGCLGARSHCLQNVRVTTVAVGTKA
mmetsp:Transcript_24694/g.57358  ORF Transcript_24694/g.57358 Transcript_24694/m.57358 type:complete len:212 (-) Transcript_24694:1506-2141(-)